MMLSGEELKKHIINLLERDKEFRYTVAGLIGLKEILDELRNLREEIAKRFEEHDRKFNEIIVRLDEHSETLKLYGKEIKLLRDDFLVFQKKLDHFEGTQITFKHRIDALGARWGLMSEDAFREGLKGVVERYFGGKVEKWVYEDKDGFVFGHPSVVDVDVVVRDGEHVLIEVKSNVDKSDVSILLRKGQLYEKVKGVKPKLAVVSPYVDDKAMEFAREVGIEVYTKLD